MGGKWAQDECLLVLGSDFACVSPHCESAATGPTVEWPVEGILVVERAICDCDCWESGLSRGTIVIGGRTAASQLYR